MKELKWHTAGILNDSIYHLVLAGKLEVPTRFNPYEIPIEFIDEEYQELYKQYERDAHLLVADAIILDAVWEGYSVRTEEVGGNTLVIIEESK